MELQKNEESSLWILNVIFSQKNSRGLQPVVVCNHLKLKISLKTQLSLKLPTSKGVVED